MFIILSCSNAIDCFLTRVKICAYRQIKYVYITVSLPEHTTSTDEPPTKRCPESIDVTVDSGETTADVSWINSFGDRVNSSLPVGEHQCFYNPHDGSGCNLTVIIRFIVFYVLRRNVIYYSILCGFQLHSIYSLKY